MELQLKRGDELLGTLRSYDSNFPWVNCKFEPNESFEELRPLFDEELRLLDGEDMTAWEETSNRILALNLKLIDLKNGNEIREFLLHIKGDEAWFRF